MQERVRTSKIDSLVISRDIRAEILVAHLFSTEEHDDEVRKFIYVLLFEIQNMPKYGHV